MLSSRAKIWSFRGKAHLVFQWCLYNKYEYPLAVRWNVRERYEHWSVVKGWIKPHCLGSRQPIGTKLSRFRLHKDKQKFTTPSFSVSSILRVRLCLVMPQCPTVAKQCSQLYPSNWILFEWWTFFFFFFCFVILSIIARSVEALSVRRVRPSELKSPLFRDTLRPVWNEFATNVILQF